MPSLQPYPRGFLIHREQVPVPVPEGWSALPLAASGWIFAHDPQEEPELHPTVDGTQWVLVHGLCLYAGDDSRSLSPARRLAEALGTSVEAFLDELDVLGGRHVVLRGGADGVHLYQDAMGMRSVYFSAEAQALASHVDLLQRVNEHRARTASQGLPGFSHAWSRTPYLGMDALLPNHELVLGSWEVRRFYPRRDNRFSGLTTHERVELFRARWDRQLTELSATGADLVMSLTGGADSRTGLALSWPHRRDFRMFTYTVRHPGKNRHRQSIARDQAIVEKLLEIMPGTRHAYFYAGEAKEPLSEQVQALLRGNTVGKHGLWLLPYYLREFPGDDVIHMRGHGYEVARAYWNVRADNDTNDSLRELYRNRAIKAAPAEPESESLEYFWDGIRRWGYDGDLHGLHRRDLYYWEMRMGRWSAEINNETDVAFQTWVGVNVRSLLEIGLAFPIGDRESGFFFAELINASYPLLNFFGKNDLRNLYEITRDEGDAQQRALSSGPVPPRVEPALLKSSRPTPTGAPLTLTGDLLIRGPGEQTRLPAQDDVISIPPAHFRPGTAAHRAFAPAPRDGELRFVLTSTYGYARAAEHWRYQVWVGDRLHASWDGGISKAPVHVTVTDLRAGDVVSLAAMALVDRSSSASWSTASRGRIEDAAFTPQALLGEACVSLDAPRASHPDHTSNPPRFSAHDIAGLSVDELPVDVPTRLDIDLGFCLVPLLVVRREQSGVPQVVTLFNGAVDLERSQGEPLFQRSTWWRDIPGSQIYVADPGTIGPDALSLAWGQVSPDSTAVPGTAQAVRLLAGVLGGPAPEQRTYFGSSAGGFWAWSAAILDPGSRAVVNNAQIDWTRWMAGAVNALRTARFDGILPAAIRTKHPARSSVLELWKQKKKPARIDYWVNVASDHDRVVDLPQVEAFAREHPELTENLRILRYDDEAAGHNPMGREDVLTALCRDGSRS